MELAALYRDIVETSPDAIWVCDLDGRTIYANPAHARALRRRRRRRWRERHRLRLPRRPRHGRSSPSTSRSCERGRRQRATTSTSMFVRRDGYVAVGDRQRDASCAARTARSSASLHRISDYSGRRRALDELRDEPASSSPRRSGSPGSAAGSGTSTTDEIYGLRRAVRALRARPGRRSRRRYAELPRDRPPETTGRPSTRRCEAPASGRRSSCSSPGSARRATAGSGPAAAASRPADDDRPGRRRCRAPTRTSPRPSSPTSPSRTRSGRTP